MSKCPTGKIGYPSKEAAAGHLGWLVARQPGVIAGRYKCRVCGEWHVGHNLRAHLGRRRRRG